MGGGEWLGKAEMHDVEYRVYGRICICEAVEGKIIPGCSRGIRRYSVRPGSRIRDEVVQLLVSLAVIVEKHPPYHTRLYENVPQI